VFISDGQAVSLVRPKMFSSIIFSKGTPLFGVMDQGEISVGFQSG